MFSFSVLGTTMLFTTELASQISQKDCFIIFQKKIMRAQIRATSIKVEKELMDYIKNRRPTTETFY